MKSQNFCYVNPLRGFLRFISRYAHPNQSEQGLPPASSQARRNVGGCSTSRAACSSPSISAPSWSRISALIRKACASRSGTGELELRDALAIPPAPPPPRPLTPSAAHLASNAWSIHCRARRHEIPSRRAISLWFRPGRLVHPRDDVPVPVVERRPACCERIRSQHPLPQRRIALAPASPRALPGPRRSLLATMLPAPARCLGERLRDEAVHVLPPLVGPSRRMRRSGGMTIRRTLTRVYKSSRSLPRRTSPESSLFHSLTRRTGPGTGAARCPPPAAGRLPGRAPAGTCDHGVVTRTSVRTLQESSGAREEARGAATARPKAVEVTRQRGK